MIDTSGLQTLIVLRRHIWRVSVSICLEVGKFLLIGGFGWARDLTLGAFVRAEFRGWRSVEERGFRGVFWWPFGRMELSVLVSTFD